MPISRKPDSNNGAAANQVRNSKLALKDSSQLPSKRTLNLCMREKSSLSVELFLIILGIILIIIMLVEFFGIYRPYVEVEAIQAKVDAAQRDLDNKNNQMKEMDDFYLQNFNMTMTEYYNQYNYEGFDRSIADRLDIFALLDREIMRKEGFMGVARIRTLTVRSNTVTITVDGLDGKQVSELFWNLSGDAMVSYVSVPVTGFNGDGTPYANLTITLKDATTVEKTPTTEDTTGGETTGGETSGDNTEGETSGTTGNENATGGENQ